MSTPPQICLRRSQIAEKVESYPDRKQQADVKNVHRFFAPLGYDFDIYTVNMTIKEYSGERFIELDGVHKVYDPKLEKRTPDGLADKLPETGTVVRPTGVSEITLRALLEGVKDSEGNAFLQRGSTQVRGRISFSTSSGRPLITLFQSADASTFLHESGHGCRRGCWRVASRAGHAAR